jgi:hypothetical protein
MALIGLNEAARLSGRNRSTLHRAMKDRRLSYTLDDSGDRRIDVAELERVFGAKVARGNRIRVKATSRNVAKSSCCISGWPIATKRFAICGNVSTQPISGSPARWRNAAG